MNNNQPKFKFKTSNNKKYEVENIWNNIVYVKKSSIK